MPACARRDIVPPGTEGIFHCWSRCVRRAFLMGRDKLTGKNYDHRRSWILERLDVLCGAFAIDLQFFSIMSNHLHLVLKTLPRRVKRMGAWEVARRWLRIFPGRRVLAGPPPEPSEEQVRRLAQDRKRIKELRKRLSDLSWFMRALKEPISRRINLEDELSGTVWEARFGCRESEGEAALLALGAYVDLNHLRAGEGQLPWDSPDCSIGLRHREAAGDGRPVPWLANLTLAAGQDDERPSASGRRASDRGCLEMTLEQYKRFLLAAAAVAGGGKAALSGEQAEAIRRRGLEADGLDELLRELPKLFPRLVGGAAAMARRAKARGRRWFQGVGRAARFFLP